MSENVEITLNGVNVSGCKYLYNSKDGLLCTLYDYNVFYDMRCSDNPDCYYKQLQREKQRNEILLKEIEIQNDIEDKYWQILKDIEEIAKAKVHTPHCFENPNCPVELVRENTSKISKYCPTIIEKYCPIKLLEEILKKTKEVENGK